MIAAAPAAIVARAPAWHTGDAVRRGHIVLYPDTIGDPVPIGICTGPDGALWFGDFGNSMVGRMTTTGVYTEYPDGLNAPYFIVAGPDGALWFTETDSGHIGRITVDGRHIKHYANESGKFPQQITVGPDHALWFTEYGAIGRVTTQGKVTHHKVASSADEFTGITTGPDRALWFSDNVDGSQLTHSVYRFLPRHRALPFTVGSGPSGIVTGPDGALWFAEVGSDAIGRLTTNGTYTEFPLGPNEPNGGIAVSPDGALWFTAENLGSNPFGEIGRMTTAGRVTFYRLPGSSPPEPMQITAGPDGGMWFTFISGIYGIGRIQP